jgi:hypothetical protein
MESHRQQRNLCDDDQIVGMRNYRIRSVPNQRGVRQYDDTRRPAPAQRRQNPNPKRLDGEIGDEKPYVDGTARSQPPQSPEPAGVKCDHERIVTRRRFPCALVQKPLRVATGQDQLSKPLQSDERQDQNRFHRHGARTRDTHDAVKPGPMAKSAVRLGSPIAIALPRTNRTVGADIFPKSLSTVLS